jgi:hypothetical protein
MIDIKNFGFWTVATAIDAVLRESNERVLWAHAKGYDTPAGKHARLIAEELAQLAEMLQRMNEED